jgi:hypothetical protein
MFHEQNIELTLHRDNIMTAHEPDYAITCDHDIFDNISTRSHVYHAWM